MTRVRLFCVYYSLCILLVWTAPSAVRAHEPNDCLIQAYRLQAELPRGTWSRLLQVQYASQHRGHIYLIWRLSAARLIRQDADGAREIHPRSLAPADVAAAADPLALSGSYVDDEPAR